MRLLTIVLIGSVWFAPSKALFASDPPPLQFTNIAVNGFEKVLEWNLYPTAEKYEIFSTLRADSFFLPDMSGTFEGNRWTARNASRDRYWKLSVTPLSSNALLSANLLNRIAYGPTPDDQQRLDQIGPQAYLEEQLNPEGLPPADDSYTFVLTNAVPSGSGSAWVSVSVTGRVTSSSLYMYLRAPGSIYLDDVALRLITTNASGERILGPNVIVNGGFESALSTGWGVAPIMAGSSLSTSIKNSGNSSLHMVASAAGSTRGSSIYQDISPDLPTTGGQLCVLSFSYLPTSIAPLLTLRLSGSGTIISGMEEPGPPQWIYATSTGRATSTPRLYLYINGAGEAWLDNIKLVAGTNPDGGPNLLQNGDFESALTGPWQLTQNFTNSSIDDTVAFAGGGSLRMVASAAGSGGGNSIYQTVAGLASGQTYTLSYWYRPASNGRTLTARLSGSQLVSSPDRTLAGIRRRLDNTEGELEDLRAWFVRNAVGSRAQLTEILLQFLENHFVTQHSKSMDYLDRFYNDTSLRDRVATDWEYREISKWRECLLRPECSFYDLLKISAESPAMIVYLDTVASRGDRNEIANENYARELFELFCNGVDNGYDQNDIVAMSRAWTGWSVDIVDAQNIDNPLAPASATFGAYPGNGFNTTSNRVGVWSFRFKNANHGTNRAPIFSEWDPNSPGDNPVAQGPKRVDARFGPPWAGTSYQLVIPPGRTGTNGLADGYDVIRHLANLPYTMEYISVKLCRLFVHDNFVHGVYDYTDPNRSEEAELVRQCMESWWNSNPKGQIRAVLATIFSSDLFRSHGGSLQKVKTPLEFAVSSIRALRSANPDGSFTSDTDGYAISGTSRTAGSAPLTRMGTMLLFDRADPDGYPETGPAWISAGTLAERLRFVQSFLIAPGSSGKSDGGNNNVCDPVALLKKRLPAESWKQAGAVAEFFLRLLYPAEGMGNLSQYRASAVDFLNTGDDGISSSAFANLSDTSSTYNTRVRGMVAMLMTLQRFQEQ